MQEQEFHTQDFVIIIPSRISSTRLERKPLKMIGDKTMVEHVYLRAASVSEQNTYVATDSEEIASVIQRIGGNVIMTESDCETGTDRVWSGLHQIEGHERIKYVINLQGDMPFVEPDILKSVIIKLRMNESDIVTPIVKVKKQDALSHSNVKVVIDNNDRALYFSRSLIPHFAEEFWYHIGIYGFKKSALQKFVELPQSYLERSENLEQLRAIENDMKISVCHANSVPISVDTQEDLEKAMQFCSQFYS